MVKGTTQIQCPNCKSPIQARILQLIDVGQNPTLKSHLLSGSFNRARCPVCNFDGAIATPLVYHDPAHELLLTYIPVEVNMPKAEQERIIGQLINRVMERLPTDQRKAYLLQPQSVLTMQGLVERVLETEGITKEDIEAQQAKMRLFEELLRLPEAELEAFVKDHDEEIDGSFFQLMSLSLQSTQDPNAREAVGQRLSNILEYSSFGQRMKKQEAELKLASESLQALTKENLTRESLLQLFIDAPSEERVVALTNLTRPALDYGFFQTLSEKIEAGEGEQQERLTKLREQILSVTQEIDRIQEARATQAASLLKALIEAENLEQTLAAAIPYIDELFLGTLEANLQAAREGGETEIIKRLEEIQERIELLIQESMPPGLQLTQELIEIEDEAEAMSLLDSRMDDIDENLLNSLMSGVDQLEKAGENDRAGQLRKLYKHALKLSMKTKMG